MRKSYIDPALSLYLVTVVMLTDQKQEIINSLLVHTGNLQENRKIRN
jgi:hypothetical protein